MSDKEYIKKLEEALSESLSLNINWTEDASDEDLNYYSEHRAVIKQAKETLKLSKNPKMGAWVRMKNLNMTRSMIVSVAAFNLGIAFKEYEHSIDGGKNWLPCGVMEEAKC
jgi:hypothetical protein